ncbi:TetR/AcrR family transcriptional regulator [Actinomadura barringtoniae]|uniref:TetR/AcrR family transcriptional regulator n=1 Tax=Actinomadura barringtoniae TaxID=1427535 RepID=A0A939PQS8_9ACTN|nr:TetR/AcrR family transcriptional regulator [Actinomadura barringtoniae]MBO2453031.1 TetR/AcrR family transcriptional regulator [Actinomadura barringtoniae]
MSPRRPERRSEEAAKAVIQAARELCQEVGYAKLSIEGIAARAGVGKNTIYRWWPSKGAVLLDGLLELWGEAAPFPDTGDAVADFKTQMKAAVGAFSSELGQHYRALLGEVQHDGVLAEALQERLLRPMMARATDRIELAKRQGQIRGDLDAELAIELLYGPIYHRWLLSQRAPEPARIEAMVDSVFTGMTPRPDL